MDETRPLLISHLIAAMLGAAWLVLVYTMPSPPPSIALLRPEEAAAVDVEFDDEKPAKPALPPEPSPATAPEKKPPTPAELKKAKKEEQAMADAFGGGSANLVGDVTNALGRAAQASAAPVVGD